MATMSTFSSTSTYGKMVRLIHVSLSHFLGYSHTAFSLFNEASISRCENYHQQIPPSSLVSHLEKSLLFQYIERHVTSQVTTFTRDDYGMS